MRRTIFCLVGVLLAVAVLLHPMAVVAQQLLDPTTHPKFVNPLPIPARIDATRQGPKDGKMAIKGRPDNRYFMEMRETVQWLGLVDGNGQQLMTTVWGYGPQGKGVTYPGPTFVAERDVPIDIRWANRLPDYNFPNGPGGHLLPVDPNIHLARPISGGIPTVTHLHGGHTESASDGLPEAWFTQSFQETGPHFVKKMYHYDNDQEAATLWYHDHALGITRLNVYAGLAGFYLLRDKNEMKLVNDGVIPGGPYEIEIVVQDRMFAADGELFYPSTDPEIEPGFEPLPAGPSAIAEFFGDFILVNGAAWPKLDVEPRKYRLRFLNGSDSRFYVLEFHDAGSVAQTFYQIGTDDGLLPKPVALTRLLLAPGERADLVVDFAGQTEVMLRNFGPDDPFKGFNRDGTLSDGAGGALPPADPGTTGKIMKFAVSKQLKEKVADATVGTGATLRPAIKPLPTKGTVRHLVLFEGLDEYGRLQPLLGTLDQGSLAWFEPITENPMLNDVEVWEVYNATEDAHPIHLHLVAFQIINRQEFVGSVTERPQPQHDGSFGVGGKLTVRNLKGPRMAPADNERGWKDTAVMLPGQVTRVVARFDREGRYVWHCHILSHEDHEMMRPFHVGKIPMAVAQTTNQAETGVSARTAVLEQNHPNPFNPVTTIGFSLTEASHVRLTIFDAAGRVVRTLSNERFAAGDYSLRWDARDSGNRPVSSGVYFYRLDAGGITTTRKMVLLR